MSSDVSLWKVQILRMTLFVPGSELPACDGWWQSVTGQPPDKEVKQAKAFQIEHRGKLADDRELVLKVTPNRIDWILAVDVDPEESQTKVASLGSFPEELSNFTAMFSRWIASIEHVERLAFGAIVVQPVETRASGYQTLNKYLPHVHVDAEARDFLYRINRPRQSKFDSPHVRINRLSAWSVLFQKQVAVRVTDQGMEQHGGTSELYACRLELDINSAPEIDHPFSGSSLPQLFGELTELGLEIAAEGDVK